MNKAGEVDTSLTATALMPVIVTVAAAVIGLGLKIIPTAISSGKILLSQANYMNLMDQYKKTKVGRHSKKTY